MTDTTASPAPTARATYVIGISAYYHDSAAALLRDGHLVAAAQEERFTRKKHEPGFPLNALKYCLHEGGISLAEVEHVVFYDKPLLKFERLVRSHLAEAPGGLYAFLMAMPVWLKEKLFLRRTLTRELRRIGPGACGAPPWLLFGEHHRSHAASAYFPSPFERAAILCLDGVGEWATTSAWVGEGNRLEPLWQIDFPHSLGLLYSAFTYYTGFKVNSGEYKLMGLAPYGVPRYADLIREHLVDLKTDGTFRLDMQFFDYAAGTRMTNERFDELFGGPPRAPESAVTQREMDLASSIQTVIEEAVLRLGRALHDEIGADSLCLAGGVALNCVANGRLLREGPFRHVWVQPAAGDAGGAVGAAYAAWHEYMDAPRTPVSPDAMSGAYLGPSYGADEIRERLNALDARYHRVDDEADLLERIALLLEEERVVGWFHGRMEFGPRALGGRSIIGDPRSPRMQSVMNLKIKHRESFRPFAPAVLEERATDWFDLDEPSPYMLLVAAVQDAHRLPRTEAQSGLFGIDQLNVARSTIPAVTHVDYSARVQTVSRLTNPRFHRLLECFERQTGCPVLVNTSFNVRGEPIVCTPDEAYRCFMNTEMDALVIEDYVMYKAEQPKAAEARTRPVEFELD